MIAKYTTIAMKNKWQIEYRNIRQGPTEIVDAHAARFRKAINKAEMKNLLPALSRLPPTSLGHKDPDFFSFLLQVLNQTFSFG